jgi:hypothetical protein
MAVTMRGEEAAAMPPEQGPDLFPVRLRQAQLRQGGSREEPEQTLAMRRRQFLQPGCCFEQKHQPVRLTLIAVLADEPA